VNNPLILIGASVRAAAQSAVRAGFSPWCVDHFADADLTLACPARSVARYPHDLPAALRDAPPGPWMYTGALENHPEIIAEIAAKRELWGNPPEVLRRVRDPLLLSETLQRKGFHSPPVALSPDELPTDGSWLIKRRKSAGGFHVRLWDGNVRGHSPEANYFQQRIDGAPCSAVFAAAAGKAMLLGATRQLIGEAWAGASGFRYVGTIGPLPLEARARDELRRLGKALSREFKLCGLFGVDFILNAAGIWPIEVNPRYTASVEVIEIASGHPVMRSHSEACHGAMLPSQEPSRVVTTAQFGKAILFAPHKARVTEEQSATLLAMNAGLEWPIVADVPQGGIDMEAGAPVVTVFAVGPTVEETKHRLRDQLGLLRRILFSGRDAGIE
jgi:predicted ATP-grasp superfamily ATP-dependent carboligase